MMCFRIGKENEDTHDSLEWEVSSIKIETLELSSICISPLLEFGQELEGKVWKNSGTMDFWIQSIGSFKTSMIQFNCFLTHIMTILLHINTQFNST